MVIPINAPSPKHWSILYLKSHALHVPLFMADNVILRQGKRIWIMLSRLVRDSPDPIRLAYVWL
jgi:hypothetical protein